MDQNVEKHHRISRSTIDLRMSSEILASRSISLVSIQSSYRSKSISHHREFLSIKVNKSLNISRRSHVPLSLSLSSLRLKNPRDSMSGFYTCEVSNEYQTLTSTGFIQTKNSSRKAFLRSIISNEFSFL